MAGKKKPSARAAFDDNAQDAVALVQLAESLENRRVRRMRAEKRDRLGEALGIPKRKRDELDCIESKDVFAVFPPGSAIDRSAFSEQGLRPLLRQALVATCAAVETFVADRVMERWSDAVNSQAPPGRLLALPMTVGDWIAIEGKYQRRKWGLREIAEVEIRQMSSPSPAQIGKTLSIVGVRDLWKKVDRHRGKKKGASASCLDTVYLRRNKIAHQGDRVGVGRAHLTVNETRGLVDEVIEIVDAIDAVT